MPVKISISTNPENGTITSDSLGVMNDRFIAGTNVIPNGGGPIVKKFSVGLMKEEFEDLIKYYNEHGGIDVVKINFCIHLDEFIACNNVDLSNSLTVVVEAAKFNDNETDYIPYNGEDDFVLIPGYHANEETKFFNAAGVPCCPSSHP